MSELVTVLTDFVDPYLDPSTGLLRNLVGARSQDALDLAEGALSYARAGTLPKHPIRATGDLAEFRAIHRHLFQDVYPWAGEIRTVDIWKNVDGAEPFLAVSVIDRGSMYAASELRDDNMFRGMGRDQFIDRLSYHYDQWNYVHPFREGNGRTQRVFWTRVAADAGWQLDWRSVQGAENDAACRVAAEARDFGPMRAMFEKVVLPVGGSADPTTAVERLAFIGPGSIDQAAKAAAAARIAGMDTPAPPLARPPVLPGPIAGYTPADPGAERGFTR